MDLGGTVSYLALTIDESSRDAAVEVSEMFRRFDSEKQIYFKWKEKEKCSIYLKLFRKLYKLIYHLNKVKNFSI